MRTTDSFFGLTSDEWEAAKGQLRAAILDAAYRRQMTSYGEIARQVSAINLEPHSVLMNQLLGAILADEHAARRPLLTAIVTHKDGDKEPGKGFYDMAKSLGYKFGAPFEFWARQVQEIFVLYGKPTRR